MHSPTWAKQRDITQMKFEKNISFYESRKIVEQRTINSIATSSGPTTKRSGVSCAHACVQNQSSSTQTDLTWTLDLKVPIAVSNIVQQKAASSCHSQTDNADSPTKGGTQPNQTNLQKKETKSGPASKTTGNRCAKG